MGAATAKNSPNRIKINRHHLFFERNSYKSVLQLAFRDTVGLVIPVPVHAHQELHAVLKPPLMPSAAMMAGCIKRLSEVDPALASGDPFYGLYAAAEFLINYAELVPDAALATRAQRISRHLELQAGILIDMAQTVND